MGDFAIFVVDENDEHLQNPIAAFHGNKGNLWNLWTVSLKRQQIKPFQIAFQTVRGKSYLSDIYVGYVELIGNEARCNRLIQTSKVVDAENDVLSPESCEHRCHLNISRPFWNKGFCTCLGISTDCVNYADFCNKVQEVPQFLKQIGLVSWNQIIIVVVTLVAFVFLVSLVILLRKKVSIIPRMISEQVNH